MDTGIIDLPLFGNINDYHLNNLSRKTERYINRKIHTMGFSPEELIRFSDQLKSKPHLLIWSENN